MHILVVQNGSAAGRRIGVESPLVIGREAADVTIPDASISRRHAVLRPAPGGVEVEDQGSRNGTFVNGHRLTGPALVKPGDVLHLGETTFKVEAAGVAPPATPPVAMPGPTAPLGAAHAAHGPGPQYAPPSRTPSPRGGIKSKPGRSSNPWVPAVIAGVVVLAAAALLWLFVFGESGKEKFIARADTICQDTFGEIQDLDGELQAAANDPVRVQQLIDDIVVRLEDTLDDIRALDEPEEDRATLGRWLAKVDQTIDAGRRLSTALAAGDATAATVAAEEFERLALEADEIGVEYGFETCAEVEAA